MFGVHEQAGASPASPTIRALGEVASRFRDMEELQVRFLQRPPILHRFVNERYHTRVDKEEYLRNVEEQKRLEKERQRDSGPPMKGMNCEQMPYGCWTLVLAALWGIGYLIFMVLKK